MYKRDYFGGLILCFVLGLLFSCGGGNKNIVDVDILHRQDSIDSALDTLELLEDMGDPPVAVDELFDDFFFTFVTNQGFQMQRIKFPVPITDGTGARVVNSKNWSDYNKFIFQDQFAVIFEDDQDMEIKNDTSINRVSVEWINLESDSADVYTFRREEKGWVLSTINQTSIIELPNGPFLDFFSNFVHDTEFQQHSIDDPLRVIHSEDTEEEDVSRDTYDASEWPKIRHTVPLPKKMLVNIDYGQPANGIRHKELLLQSLNDNLFIKLKFHKYRTDWKLIEIEN